MRRALWLFVGLAFGACTLPSADEFAKSAPDRGASSSGATGSLEAGSLPTADGGEIAEASVQESGVDAGVVNLMANPGFEDGTCGPVNFYQGSGGGSADAHGGSHACQACRANEGTDFYTFNPFFVVMKPVVGATYHASAWVKRGAESFKDQTITISLRAANTEPTFQEQQVVGSLGVPLTDQWQPIEVKLTLSKDAQEIDFFVGASTLATAGQRCFLVDDVAVWRE